MAGLKYVYQKEYKCTTSMQVAESQKNILCEKKNRDKTEFWKVVN
jgi:hypothetical protein